MMRSYIAMQGYCFFGAAFRPKWHIVLLIICALYVVCTVGHTYFEKKFDVLSLTMDSVFATTKAMLSAVFSYIIRWAFL